MKGRFCYFAERHFGPREFSRVVETLQGAGITLANPGSGGISCLTEDGDQVQGSQSEIAAAIEASSPITFQVWFSEDTDVLCSIYKLDGGALVHRYNLDGLAASERGAMAKWAIDYFKERSGQHGMLLLVCDDEGSTAEFDWDGFVEGRCAPPPLPPEIIGVCSPLDIAGGDAVIQLGACRLFTNRASRPR